MAKPKVARKQAPKKEQKGDQTGNVDATCGICGIKFPDFEAARMCTHEPNQDKALKMTKSEKKAAAKAAAGKKK